MKEVSSLSSVGASCGPRSPGSASSTRWTSTAPAWTSWPPPPLTCTSWCASPPGTSTLTTSSGESCQRSWRLQQSREFREPRDSISKTLKTRNKISGTLNYYLSPFLLILLPDQDWGHRRCVWEEQDLLWWPGPLPEVQELGDHGRLHEDDAQCGPRKMSGWMPQTDINKVGYIKINYSRICTREWIQSILTKTVTFLDVSPCLITPTEESAA